MSGANPGYAQDTNDMAGKQGHLLEHDGRARRNSIPSYGINQTGDLTKSLLPDNIIRESLLSDPNFINAWMNLNVGFFERFKGIKESFRNKKLNFFEHIRGKKWQNVKKICPQIKREIFLNNHKEVYNKYINEWRMINHKYLIREVELLPMKPCCFCNKELKIKDEVSLLP